MLNGLKTNKQTNKQTNKRKWPRSTGNVMAHRQLAIIYVVLA